MDLVYGVLYALGYLVIGVLVIRTILHINYQLNGNPMDGTVFDELESDPYLAGLAALAWPLIAFFVLALSLMKLIGALANGGR